jgi:hypothetical protein
MGGAPAAHFLLIATPGGGFDASPSPHVGIRLAQVDYLQTRVAGESQNHVRFSAGIVFKFQVGLIRTPQAW